MEKSFCRRALSSSLIGATALLCLAFAPISARAAACGDGVIDAGEECDDSNVVDGDCCSSACLFEASGSACADDGSSCTLDQCDGAGTCSHGPIPRVCSTALNGRLWLMSSPAGRNRFHLNLSEAPAADAAAFGDPENADAYQACVFGADGLVMEGSVAPSGMCGDRPCWRPIPRGFVFHDDDGSNAGINRVVLQGSPKARTRLLVRGHGANLPPPVLPLAEPAMAQIVNTNTGQCFDVYFLAPDSIKLNSARQIRAKAGLPEDSNGALGLQPVEREVDPVEPTAAKSRAEVSTRSGPNPSQVYLQSISYGGSGCPQGSVTQSFSDDRTAFTLSFSSFIASSGPGVSATEARKNCQINLNLHVPQGWQFSIASMDYRGNLQLPAGLTATQKSIYYFQGETAQVSGDANFVGPLSRDYLIRDHIPLTSVAWSECNAVRPININSQIRINNPMPGLSGQITTGSFDGKTTHILGFQWKRC